MGFYMMNSIVLSKRSCETQLITTVIDFAECLNQNGQCDVLLLDFCKAFDKVAQICLFEILSYYGICDTLLLWFKSFLSNKLQCVVLDNQKNHPTEVLSGVLQGTVLALYNSCYK